MLGGVGQRATCLQDRKQDTLLRAKHRRGFRHEADSTEDNHVLRGSLCDTTEFQRVASKVGNILHLRPLIVVCQDEGVAVAFQFVDPPNKFSGMCCHCQTFLNDVMRPDFGPLGLLSSRPMNSRTI